MTLLTSIFLAGFLATAFATKDSVRGLRPSVPSSNKVTLSNPCMLLARHTQYEDIDAHGHSVHTSKAQWDCDLQGIDVEASGNERVEVTGLDKDFRAISGVSMLFAQGAELANGQLKVGGLQLSVHQNEILLAERSDQRRLNVRKSLGQKTVLVVRVSSNSLGSRTTATSTQLSDKIFGTAGDQVNLATWFNQCSHGDLTFSPFRGIYNGVSITNGVLDVTVNLSNGSPEIDMRKAMISAVQARLKISNLHKPVQGIDHIMLVLPPNTVGSWVAYAWLDGHISVFNDGYGSSPSAQMHEIGHNLGLNHANENGVMYEDRSGMMGYSYKSDEWPKQCFNPANNWHLGWYSGQRTDWNPLTMGSWSGTLLGVASYTRNNLDRKRNVVVRLGDGITEGDLYIGFNSAIGVNSETMESRDMIVVVRDNGADEVFNNGNTGKTAYTESTLIASLARGTEYIVRNYKGSNRDLKIRFSGFTDGANVDVSFLGPCRQNSDCSVHTCAPAGTCQAGSCIFDESKCSLVSLAVVTGSNPKGTAYSVVDNCSGEQVLSAAGFYEEGATFGTELPISQNGQYTITLHDPSGESLMLVDGQEVLAAGSADLTYKIGTECPTLPTTSAPTATHTIVPSHSPSVAPSTSPSSVPSHSPSAPSNVASEFSESQSSAENEEATFDSFSESFDPAQPRHFVPMGQGTLVKADEANKKYTLKTAVLNQLDKPRLESEESIDVAGISRLTVEINFQVRNWRSAGGLAVHYRTTGSTEFKLLTDVHLQANPLLNLRGLGKEESSISYDFDVSGVEGEIFLRIMNDGSSRRDRLDFNAILVSGSS